MGTVVEDLKLTSLSGMFGGVEDANRDENNSSEAPEGTATKCSTCLSGLIHLFYPFGCVG